LKIIIGAAIIAAGITAEVLSAGAATPFLVGMALTAVNAGIALGASLVMSGIAELFQRQTGTPVNSKNPIEPWQVIVGRARVGGVVVSICEDGSDNKYLHMVIPIAGHQIKSIDAIYLNGYQCYLDGFSGAGRR
jgi:hypothetical protein